MAENVPPVLTAGLAEHTPSLLTGGVETLGLIQHSLLYEGTNLSGLLRTNLVLQQIFPESLQCAVRGAGH